MTTVHQILMKFGRKLQNMVYRHLPQIRILGKSRSQDNVLNPLENNRIKKIKGFGTEEGIETIPNIVR